MALKQRLMTALAVVCIFLAVGIMAYPAISSFVNEKYSSEIRTSYEEQLEQVDTSTLDALRASAEAYNMTLSSGVTVFNKETIQMASQDYDSQLDPMGNAIMGYVEIPKLGLELPIYHGTESETLERGIGHLVGTSLPIGGESAHTVLTGHSGMASQKMFTDLHEMHYGDIFYLRVLNETLAYKVINTFKVEPYDSTHLAIQEGKDLCTLVTCTPIGINSHRLLIQGERTPVEEVIEVQQAEQEAPSKITDVSSSWETQYIMGIFGSVIGITALLCVYVVCIWVKRWTRRCWRGKYVK